MSETFGFVFGVDFFWLRDCCLCCYRSGFSLWLDLAGFCYVFCVWVVVILIRFVVARVGFVGFGYFWRLVLLIYCVCFGCLVWCGMDLIWWLVFVGFLPLVSTLFYLWFVGLIVWFTYLIVFLWLAEFGWLFWLIVYLGCYSDWCLRLICGFSVLVLVSLGVTLVRGGWVWFCLYLVWLWVCECFVLG